MKDKLREFLHFGKSERNAIGIVLIIIVLATILPSYLAGIKNPEVIEISEFKSEVDAFLRKSEIVTAADQQEFDFYQPDKSAAADRINPFRFDPNTLDAKGWERLGFSKKQSESIVKFREKGGTFRKKEDLKKLFVIDEAIYNKLEPFVIIDVKAVPAFTKSDTASTKSYRKKEFATAELNSADSAALVNVRGIGPAFARRIIRYREKLGGYSDLNQLLDVYGIDSTRFLQIERNLSVDQSLIKKININSASIDQLRAHPYLDYFVAKAIVDKRIQKGAYTHVSQIMEIPLVYEALYLKIKPYLTVDKTHQ